MTKKITASVSISRPTGCDAYRDEPGTEYGVICINVKDESSRAGFLTIHMRPEDFALAITGLSEIKCAAEVRNLDVIGKKKVDKQVRITVTLPTHDRKAREAILREAAKPYEVNGWMADARRPLLVQNGLVAVQGEKDVYTCSMPLFKYEDEQED